MRLIKSDSVDKWLEFKVDSETGLEATEESKKVEIVKIGLRRLKYRDINRIQEEAYEIQSGGKGVKTAFNYSKYCEGKLLASIVKWENVLDEEGNPASVDPENIRLLPCWIAQKLEDEIDNLNSLGTNFSRD